MSAGALYQHVLRRVMRLGLVDEARRDVVAALEAARSESLLQLLYEAAHEAGHAREPLLDRAAGVFCAFAAGNLADDLVDGDCTYLDPAVPAVRLAPTVQWLLQHLSTSLLLDGGVPPASLSRASELLAQAAGPQQLEVRTTQWTAARFIEVGEGIVGRQWQAYLVALWGGTALEGAAEELGMALGFTGHVAIDVRTGDARFHSMSAADKQLVLDDARARLAVVEHSSARIAALVLESVRPALRSAAVAAFYDGKTTRILERYGPGPRVHYHTGTYASPGRAALAEVDGAELRRRMVHAQEALVHESLAAWGLTDRLAGLRVLDCGCGLGGTALLLAGAGALVTALTVCAPHVEVVRDFALQAGLAERIDARFQAVEDLDGEADGRAWDVALAIESSCYFDRAAWFQRMARALVPGGRVLLVDLFAGRDDVKAPFDAAWRTDLGTLVSYDDAARAAGFTRVSCTDLSAACAGFWDLTRTETARALAAGADGDVERLRASLVHHDALERGARDGGLLHLRLEYQRV